jgi:hypothetical protein
MHLGNQVIDPNIPIDERETLPEIQQQFQHFDEDQAYADDADDNTDQRHTIAGVLEERTSVALQTESVRYLRTICSKSKLSTVGSKQQLIERLVSNGVRR